MGDPTISLERFRPNSVLIDLPAYEEDFVLELLAQSTEPHALAFLGQETQLRVDPSFDAVYDF